jgi:hypothetical protein
MSNKSNSLKLLLLFLFLVAFKNSIGQVLPKPVSSDYRPSNEPSIGIDPFAGRVLVGTNNNQLYLSKDGGFSFQHRTLESSLGVWGDPVIFIDRWGNYFYAHLARAKGKKAPEMWDRIVVQKSTNLGDSFSDGVGVGYVPGKMQDKHWLTGDLNKKSPYVDRLYLTWTEFDKYKSADSKDSSRIKFSYSDNFGDTFSKPVIISDSSGDCLDDDNTLEGATIAVGPKGELYCVWAGRGNIYMDISLDGGKTWGTDQIIAKQIGGWSQQVPFMSRCNSLPFVFVSKKGVVNVIFGDARYGDLDIIGVFSKDGGLTFESPVRINNDPVGNGKDQFMPNFGYDRLKKCFYICYYSRENSDFNMFQEVKMAGGKKLNKLWYTTLSEMPSAPPYKAFFGDYLDADATDGAIGVVWTERDPKSGVLLVKTTLGEHKAYKKNEVNYLNRINELVVEDSNLLYINYTIGANKGYKISVERYNKVVYQRNELEPVSPGTYEEKLRLKFISGTYEIKLTYKGQSISKKFTIK